MVGPDLAHGKMHAKNFDKCVLVTFDVMLATSAWSCSTPSFNRDWTTRIGPTALTVKRRSSCSLVTLSRSDQPATPAMLNTASSLTPSLASPLAKSCIQRFTRSEHAMCKAKWQEHKRWQDRALIEMSCKILP